MQAQHALPEPKRYVISFRSTLRVDDLGTFSKTIVSSLEQALPCVNIRIRVYELQTEPHVRAVVSARLTVPACQGMHGLCRHAEPLNQAACDNLLIREISVHSSDIHAGPFRRLFEDSGVVPAESSLHDSLATKIQRSWRRSHLPDSPSPGPSVAVPLNPWPSALRREEAAKTLQRAWRTHPEMNPEDSSIDLKTAMREFRSPLATQLTSTESPWGLRRDLRPRFHATRKSEHVMLSFDRREAEICLDFRSGRVFLEQESRAFDFEILEFPTTRDRPSIRVGFVQKLVTPDAAAEPLVVSTEISGEELRVGRVVQVRLIEAEISRSFAFLGVFCQGNLIAPAARVIGNFSDQLAFVHGAIDFSGKIRLVKDPSHPMTTTQMIAQIEQSGNSFFFARPEITDDSMSDVVYKISSLMRDVQENTRRIEALAVFDPQDGAQVLHDLPVRRNSLSIPRLVIPPVVAAPSALPPRAPATALAPATASLAGSAAVQRQESRGRRKSSLQEMGRYKESREAEVVEGRSMFTEASVFSGSETFSVDVTPRSKRRLSRTKTESVMVKAQASTRVAPAVPERRGEWRQAAVKKKVSNKKEPLMKKPRSEDEESSSWSVLFEDSESENASKYTEAKTESESSGWF